MLLFINSSLAVSVLHADLTASWKLLLLLNSYIYVPKKEVELSVKSKMHATRGEKIKRDLETDAVMHATREEKIKRGLET